MKKIGLIILVFTICFFANCKKDENNSGENNYITDCCKIPPTDECYKGGHIFIPNAFTPNGDGLNDIFQIHVGEEFNRIVSFKIFDAEENIVWESFDYQPFNPIGYWDGRTIEGEEVPAGIYEYECVIRAIDGAELMFSGFVCNRPEDERPCVDNEKKCAYGSQHNGLGAFDFFQNTGEQDCN